jgi:hypothetical protein
VLVTIDNLHLNDPRPPVTVYCLHCGQPEATKDRELRALRKIAGLNMVRNGLNNARYVSLEIDMSPQANVAFGTNGTVMLSLDS